MSGIDYIGTFNNEDRNDVQQIKECAVNLIDLIEKYGIEEDRVRVASRYIETGTMFGIKSIFS